MQMHRQEDPGGMFSQCFCELARQVAETLCQHLSLLDSEKNGQKGTNRRRERDREGESGQKKHVEGLRKFTRTEKIKGEKNRGKDGRVH